MNGPFQVAQASGTATSSTTGTPVRIYKLTKPLTDLGMVFQGGGLGLLGNIICGIVGGFIGYWLLPKLNVHINTGTGWLDYVLTAAIGASVLLIIINLIFQSE